MNWKSIALKVIYTRDRLVVGIRGAKLSETLQLDSDLNLEKVITQIRQAETVRQQQPC